MEKCKKVVISKNEIIINTKEKNAVIMKKCRQQVELKTKMSFFRENEKFRKIGLHPSFFRNFTFRGNSNPRVFKQSVMATKIEGAIETTYHFKFGCRILSYVSFEALRLLSCQRFVVCIIFLNLSFFGRRSSTSGSPALCVNHIRLGEYVKLRKKSEVFKKTG